MDAPGISMFTGAGSLHIDRSAQERLDEQEELEDQKRREKELQAKLLNAFDDLADEDEPSSINSSQDHTALDGSRAPLHTAHAPVADMPKIRNPPTYTETLSHMMETGPYEMTPTPQREYGRYAEVDEQPRARYSPRGAGDAEDNSYFPNEFRGHLVGQHNGVNSYEAKQQMLNVEQLKMMYEMRVKECQQLAEQLESAQSQGEAETDALRARLTATVSDRDQAQLALQQTQRQLATSKHQIVELQQEMCEVKDRLNRMSDEKERVALELHATSLGLQDAQQRLQAAQVARTHDTDALFREQHDRHREECERMREDLEKAKNRLADKEREVLVVERRAAEAERGREETLVERGAAVNRLATELEAAQARLAGSDSSLQRAHLQLKDLGAKLEQTAEELVSSRKECSRIRQEYEDWRGALHQTLRDAGLDSFYHGGSPKSPAKLSTLKDILGRYKQQTIQINKLTEQMNKKDKKLESCRKLESELRSQLEEYKGMETQLNSRVAVLQNKLELLGRSNDTELLESFKMQNQQLEQQLHDLRNDLETMESNYGELERQHEQLKTSRSGRKSLEREANADLLRELDQLSTRLKDSLRENGELKSLYLQVCSAKDVLVRELQEARTKLTTAHKEKTVMCEREKTNAEQLEKERQQVEMLLKEIDKQKAELEEANTKLASQQKEYTDKQKLFADKLYKYIKDDNVPMSKEPEPCRNCEKHARTISQLEMQIQQYAMKLEMQESNELLLKELRSKAEYFEQYIVQRFKRLQTQCHASTNTDPITNGHTELDEDTPSKDEEEPSDMYATKTDLMMQEKQIREQIAEKYTKEIKTIETNCTKKINELKKENAGTISKLKELLETKAQEVEVLKKFIVSERTKVTELLQIKEKELTSALQENRSLQEEYRELREKATDMKQALEKSHTKNLRLKADLEKKSSEVVVERERSARALAEMAEQLRSLDAKASHIETEHDHLKDKYRNIKKTALVYKEYASKKDAHVESELERIKSHYEGEVGRLHEKLQRLINKRREIQVNERISKMQSDFDAMVSEVNSAT